MLRPEELFQRLSLCETLRRVFSLYVSEIGLFTKIAVVCFFAIVVTWSLVLLPMLLTVMGVDSEDFQDPDFIQSHLADYIVLIGMDQIVALAIGSVGAGAFCLALADLHAGRRPDWIVCLKGGLKNARSLWLAAFLGFLGTFLGLMLLIVPGIYVSMLVALFVPPIVIEKVGPFRSIARSAELVNGNWCYVWCTMMIVTTAVMAVQSLWSTLMTGSSDLADTIFSITGSIVALVPGMLFGPIYACAQFAIYINLRVQKEGMTLAILVNEYLGEPSEGEGSYSQVAVVDEEVAGSAPLVSAV